MASRYINAIQSLVRQQNRLNFVLEFLLPPGLIDESPPYWFATIGAGSIHPYDGRRHAAPEAATVRVLILEPAGEGEGGAFISRYDETGGFIGDSWFATRQAAVEDAAAEFDESLGRWQPVPAGEVDPETYALRCASQPEQGQ